MFVTSSCGPRLVVNGPTSASSTGTTLLPVGDRTSKRAPSARRTAGKSEAGSACTTLPPIVSEVAYLEIADARVSAIASRTEYVTSARSAQVESG